MSEQEKYITQILTIKAAKVAFSLAEVRLMVERGKKNTALAAFSSEFWLPLADTLLTNTPKYGSSNMIRMRKLLNDVRCCAPRLYYTCLGQVAKDDMEKVKGGFRSLYLGE